MSVTYSPTQTASFIATLVDPTTNPLPVDYGTNAAALIRFQFSTTIYFISTLTLTFTLQGTPSGSEVYNIYLVTDPDMHGTLVFGNLADTDYPSAIYTPGTATAEIVSTKTISTYGAVTFDLDLAKITSLMSASTSPTNIWNGSLLFWVQGVGSNINRTITSLHTIALTAYDTIDYPNRDTGSRGDESSRWDRCPVSGLKIPRGKMVVDGYRGILVHPDSYDPEEPEATEFTDYPDENEAY